MRTLLIGLSALALLCGSAFAQVNVRGYYRSNGTYVQPHVRSAPDSTTSNNYGPSRSSPHYAPPSVYVTPPVTRDHDRGGLANMYDNDDDNDGISDDRDRSQYGARGSYGETVQSYDPWKK